MVPIIQNPSLRRFEVQRDLAALTVLVCACSFPFLGQPFHMDDAFYMDMARNARVNPWFPYDTPYVFEGWSVPDMGSHSHPPLQTYFLALIQSVAGEGPEWIYHLCALIYPLLAVVAMYFLAARFVARPLWPCMALAVAPLFQVMQHNLMTDLPTLAFWLAAIACHLWAIDLNRNRLYVASSLFQFAAIFTSYQAVALVPLLAFYQWRRGKGFRGWIALAAPLLLIASWFGLNYLHYHRFILGDTAGYIRSRNYLSLGTIVTKLVAVLQYQGWLVLFPVFPLYLLARGLRGRLLALFGLIALYAAQILPAEPAEYRMVEKAIFIVGLITGVFLLIHMVVFFIRTVRDQQDNLDFDRVDGQFLSLWYLGVVGYCLFLFTEGSARYILPLVPPLLLYFFKVLEVREVQEYRQKRPPLMGSAMTATGALVLSLAWGLLLSHADLEFARMYPRAASEVSRIAEGARLYYGGEWGFRYYLQKAGALQLPVDETEVRGGSLLAYPRLASSYYEQTPHGLRSMLIPFETLEYSVRTPLRLLDKRSHAGFYSTGWGLLPFSFSRKPVESIEIRQVNFMIERLPWAQIETRAGENPWPGFLSDQDQSPSILVRPGTRMLYPWTEENPRRLELKCGISADSVKEGSTFEFSIRQLDARGGILAECSKTLHPSSRKEDRGWQPLALELRGRAEGGETLEFRYSSSEEGGLGAFALARLSAPRP